jgi:isopenicillin-N epimerase
MPFRSPDEVTAAVESALSGRTRLVVIDHITSPTAIIFPVREIIDRCAARGVDVLVDGAHAPGMIELDIESLGAAYYCGNLHKWCCAPKGAAFLWVRPDRQKGVHPPTISHFLDQGLTAEFDWQGTTDITAWLSAPAAIEFLSRFGWDRVREHNHRLATWSQQHLCDRWRTAPNSPADGSMLGSMTTVTLPQPMKRFESREAITRLLFERFRVEAPAVDWAGGRYVRPCCQVYNTAADIERLAEAVTSLC